MFPPQQIICSIPLSNSSDEMVNNVLTTLCEKLRTKIFSLEIDKSTLPDNQALLLVMWDPVIIRKYVKNYYSEHILTYTKGSSIYNLVEICFNENNIPLVSCATDGTPSMVGRHWGFLSYLKK